MIRRCFRADKLAICAIINDAAQAYEGRVAQHFLSDPYMSLTELEEETNTVTFYGHEEQGALEGIMGIEVVRDVTLLRHAYVRSTHQRRGIGTTPETHHLGDIHEPAASGYLGEFVGGWLLPQARISVDARTGPIAGRILAKGAEGASRRQRGTWDRCSGGRMRTPIRQSRL